MFSKRMLSSFSLFVFALIIFLGVCNAAKLKSRISVIDTEKEYYQNQKEYEQLLAKLKSESDDEEQALRAPTVQRLIKRDTASCPTEIDCGAYGTCNTNTGHCDCNTYYTGSDCSIYDRELTASQIITASVGRREWKFFHISLPTGASVLSLIANQTTTGDCDVYLRQSDYPNKLNYTARDIGLDSNSKIDILNAASGTWYAGVYGFQPCTFNLEFLLNSDACNCNGHGSCSAQGGACQCDPGYYGQFCENVPAVLTSEVAVESSVANAGWNYYQFTPATRNVLFFYVNESDSGVCDTDLFIKYGVLPTPANYDYREAGVMHHYSLVIPHPQLGVYYLGIYGYHGCQYRLLIHTSNECASQCSLHGDCQVDTCSCYDDYTGEVCETSLAPLVLSTPVQGFVSQTVWNYYHIHSSTGSDLIVTVNQINSGADCDLYIKKDMNPSLSSHDYYDSGVQSQYSLRIHGPGDNTWYLGIYGYQACQYTVIVTEESASQCVNDCSGHGSCINNACECENGYSGIDCSIVVYPFSNGQSTTVSVNQNNWVYYSIVPTGSELSVYVHETSTTGGVSVYLRAQSLPDLRFYDASEQTSGSWHRIHFTNLVPQQTYYIGIYGSTIHNEAVQCNVAVWATPF